MRSVPAWLFPALLVLSAIGHFWIVGSFAMPSALPKLDFASVETTEVSLVEEMLPEPIPEPIPEPEEIRAPITEEIPTPEASEQKVAPPAAPERKPIEKKSAQKKPASPPASKTANVPEPVVVRNPPPFYPETARRSGWEGRVIVRAEVSANGIPTSVTLAKSSGYGVLDQAALRAVKGWRFQPRTLGGVPLAGTVEVPVNFSLNR